MFSLFLSTTLLGASPRTSPNPLGLRCCHPPQHLLPFVAKFFKKRCFLNWNSRCWGEWVGGFWLFKLMCIYIYMCFFLIVVFFLFNCSVFLFLLFLFICFYFLYFLSLFFVGGLLLAGLTYHMYLYVYSHTYKCIHLYTYIYIYVYTYTYNIFVYVYMYMYVHTCIQIYVLR